MKINKIFYILQITLFLFSLYLSSNNVVYAKSIIWNKTESSTLFYYANRWGCCGWTKALGTRNISVTYNAEIKNVTKNLEVVGDNSQVAVGSTLRFTFIPHKSEDIYWFGTGYTDDSPYGDWVANAAEQKGTITGTRWIACTVGTTGCNKLSGISYIGDSHYGEYGAYENIYSYDCNEKDLVQSGVYSYETSTAVGPFDVYVPLSINPPSSKTLTGTTNMTCGSKKGSETSGYYYDCILNSIGTVSPVFNFSSTFGKFYYRYWDYRNYGNYVAGCYRTDYPLSSVDGGDYPSKGVTYQLQVPAQTINYTIKVRTPLPPNSPTITGPINGYVGKTYNFSINGTHPDGLTIKYGIDWNKDGTVDQWLPSSGYTNSGTTISFSKSWTSSGVVSFQAKTVDSTNASSTWTNYNFNVANLPVANISLNPTTVMDRGSSTITWSSTNSSSCTASGSWTGKLSTSTGDHSTSTGILDITTATKTYTYTIKCYGIFETSSASTIYDTKSASLTVSAFTPVVNISANPSEISKINTSSTVSWSSIYTDANSCSKTMASGTDPVWTAYPSTGRSTTSSGSTQKFTKNGIYVYKVTCTGNTLSVFATTSVKVNIGASVKLVATPDQITSPNSSSTLVWTSNDVIENTCSKTMASGTDSTWTGTAKPSFGTSSSQIYTKNGSYIYKVQCDTPSGIKASSTVVVNVNVPFPTVSLIANPSSVGRTSSSTLTWSSTNTNNNSCTKSMVAKTDSTWSGVTNPSFGSQKTQKFGTSLTSTAYDGTYIYKISCVGPAGIASTTATVSVGQYPGPSVVIDAPDSVEPGTNPVITWTALNSTSCVKTSGNGSWSGTVNNITTSPYQVTELPGSINNTTTYTINCTGPNGNTGNVSKTINVVQCRQDNWSCTNWNPNPCTVGQMQTRICTNNIINQCPSNILLTPEVSRVCSNAISVFYPLCQAYQDFGNGLEASTGTIFINRDMQWRATNIPAGDYSMISNFGDNRIVSINDYLTFYKLYQNPGIKNFSIKLESLDGMSIGDCSTTTNAINKNQIIIEE